MEHPLWAVFRAWGIGVDVFRKLVFHDVWQIKWPENSKKMAKAKKKAEKVFGDA